MVNKSVHVVPRSDSWSVRKGGAEKASKSFDKKDAAIHYAREISKSQHSELYIHKNDGTIQIKESYVKDPNSSKYKS